LMVLEAGCHASLSVLIEYGKHVLLLCQHVRVYRFLDDEIRWVKIGDDIDGEAVGATPNDENGSNCGQVRVFKLDASTSWA